VTGAGADGKGGGEEGGSSSFEVGLRPVPGFDRRHSAPGPWLREQAMARRTLRIWVRVVVCLGLLGGPTIWGPPLGRGTRGIRIISYSCFDIGLVDQVQLGQDRVDVLLDGRSLRMRVEAMAPCFFPGRISRGI